MKWNQFENDEVFFLGFAYCLQLYVSNFSLVLQDFKSIKLKEISKEKWQSFYDVLLKGDYDRFIKMTKHEEDREIWL